MAKSPSNKRSAGNENDSLVYRIITYLREKRLEPGDRLPGERHLAEKFSVGRNTLREALAALIALRVLEARPHSGVYLRDNATEASFETLVLLAELGAHPSPQEVLDSIEVRLSLELQAVKLACDRRNDEDLEKLAKVVEDTDAALERGENIYQLDQAFHMALAEAAHNQVLVSILHAFYRLSLVRRQQIFEDPAKAKHSAVSHKAMLGALRDRKADKAYELMTEHLTTGRRYWEEILKT